MPRTSPKNKSVKPIRVERAGPTLSSPAEPGSTTWKVLLILLAGLFIYAPVFHGGWLWDDDQEVTANAVLADPGGLVSIWTGAVGADYFPLKTTVQWVFYRFNETNPTGWHLLNIALHLLNALLVWKLLQRMKIPGAWFGGLLFCVHPIMVESVAWVSELKNTLSLPFLLLSLMAWVNFEEKKREPDYYWALGLFLASILCKTSVVMFPFVLLLYCWWQRGRIGRSEILRSVPFFLISLGMGLVTIYFQFSRAIGAETIPVGGMLSRIATGGVAIFFYLYKCILPFGLIPIYPRWEVDPPPGAMFLAWPALAALVFWFWSQRKTWGRHVLFGLGFFLITVFPVLGFVTMSYMRITWVADHFLYLPVLGLIGLAAGAAGTLYAQASQSSERALRWAGVALLALLILQSHRYAGIFVNEYEMWTYTIERNPHAWQAHSRLGKVLLDRQEYEQAFQHIQESVRLRPDLAETHNNLGAMLERKGDVKAALAQLRIAVQLAPTISIYRMNLGTMLLKAGEYREGEAIYDDLLKESPNNPTFLCNRGVALHFQGRGDEAIASFRAALAIGPNLKDAQENLALALKKKEEAGGPAEETPSTEMKLVPAAPTVN